MIAPLLLMAAVDAPRSETTGAAFPARELSCTAVATDGATFAVTVKQKDRIARLKSGREDLFPSGAYAVGQAFITRSEAGQPLDYRVAMSMDGEAGHASLGLQVHDGIPDKGWIRITPPGPLRSDRIREIGSVQCIAEKKS